MKKSSIILVLALLVVAAGLLVYFAGRGENRPTETAVVPEAKTEEVTPAVGTEAPYGDYSLVEGGVATSEHFMLEATPQNVKKPSE